MDIKWSRVPPVTWFLSGLVTFSLGASIVGEVFLTRTLGMPSGLGASNIFVLRLLTYTFTFAMVIAFVSVVVIGLRASKRQTLSSWLKGLSGRRLVQLNAVAMILFMASSSVVTIFPAKLNIAAGSISVTESYITLRIDKDGSGLMNRSQKFYVSRPLSRIEESDIRGAGALSAPDISSEIYDITEETIKQIPCTSRFDKENELVVELGLAHLLMPGRNYMRVTNLIARGAYENTDSDEFALVVNSPLQSARIIVEFASGREVEPGSVVVNLRKESGLLLAVPKSLQADHISENRILFSADKPNIGNEYNIKWRYKVAAQVVQSP